MNLRKINALKSVLIDTAAQLGPSSGFSRKTDLGTAFQKWSIHGLWEQGTSWNAAVPIF